MEVIEVMEVIVVIEVMKVIGSFIARPSKLGEYHG